MGDHDTTPLWLRDLIADVRVADVYEDCPCRWHLAGRDYFCLSCRICRCEDCYGVSPDCDAAGHVSILIHSVMRMIVVRHTEVQGHIRCSNVRRQSYGFGEWVLVVKRKGLPSAPPDPFSIPCYSHQCHYYYCGLPDPDDEEYTDPRKLYCSINCMIRDNNAAADEHDDYNGAAAAAQQNNLNDAAAEQNGQNDALDAEEVADVEEELNVPDYLLEWQPQSPDLQPMVLLSPASPSSLIIRIRSSSSSGGGGTSTTTTNTDCRDDRFA